MTEQTPDPTTDPADPAVDAGWLVDTPWLGYHAAVFSTSKADALAQADRARSAHIADLQAQIDQWRRYELAARYVEALND